MPRNRASLTILSLVFAPSLRAALPGEEVAKLDQLITEYFKTDDAKARTNLVGGIEKAADGSIQRVAEMVRKTQLWGPLPAMDRVVVPTISAGHVGAIYHGFKNPEPSQARGMVLCRPAGEGLEEANLAINRAVMILGPALHDHSFIVALDRPVAGRFHQHPAAGDDFRKIIRELRRRLRLDADRVFLFGDGEGGEAAWNAALFHPHLFAGVIVVASRPRLPYPEQLTPLLLPNLRNLPVLSIWESDAGEKPEGEALVTAVYNRAIVQFAEQHGLPLQGLETAFQTQDTLGELPNDSKIEPQMRAFAQRRRPAPGGKVARWFRFAGQGDLGWVRAAKLHGDAWTDDQLSIAPSAKTDRDAFITAFFKEKLFFLSGEVAEQTIAIETKGVAKVDVFFFEGMMDYTQPVTVICNDRKRFEGLIKPSIATLLEKAYEDWEFQRPVYSTLTFSIRADGGG